jgi:hypothetical protein
LFQQPPFPYNYPLLFVIPSEAEGSAVLFLIIGGNESETADPSASLGMTKRRER